MNKQQNSVLSWVDWFDALQELYDIIAENFWLYTSYTAWLLIPLALTNIATAVVPAAYQDPTQWAIAIFGIILSGWVDVCLIITTSLRLKNTATEHINTENVGRYAWKALPTFLAIRFLSFFATLVGTFLLVIPGIMAFSLTLFAQYISVLHGVGIKDAFKLSYSLGKKSIFRLFFNYICGIMAIALVYIVITSGILQIPGVSNYADLVQSLLGLFFVPIAVLYPFVLYRRLLINIQIKNQEQEPQS